MRAALAFALWLGLCGPALACRQALVLGLDVSGSVDEGEYRLQMDGLARALDSADVRHALLNDPAAPVRLAVFEWSGPGYQRLILPWSQINSGADVDRVVTTLLSTTRQEAELSTAIGAALAAGAALLADQPGCLGHTLDLSGDGPSNTGPRPQIIRDRNLPSHIIVNGLVIGEVADDGDDRAEDIRELAAYYEGNVIAGPGAFVEMAVGFAAYQEAMERKLLRELRVLAIGALAEEGKPGRG